MNKIPCDPWHMEQRLREAETALRKQARPPVSMELAHIFEADYGDEEPIDFDYIARDARLTKTIDERCNPDPLAKDHGSGWSDDIADSVLAKRASTQKVARVERNGNSISEYDENGSLLRTYLADPNLDDDPATLRKDAATVDLTKRSSSPYKIRLEKTMIDGQEWVLGFNHQGECVYTRDPDQQRAIDKIDEAAA